MKHDSLENMFKGWFVGNFSPTAYVTDACEVAVKKYLASEKEESHFHKKATEITLILSGKVRMMNADWSAGDILVLDPGDVTSFEAIEDSVTVVVKVPGATNDKYLAK